MSNENCSLLIQVIFPNDLFNFWIWALYSMRYTIPGCIDQIVLNWLKWQWFSWFKRPSNSMNIRCVSKHTMFGWIQKVLHKFDLGLFVVKNQTEFVGGYFFFCFCFYSTVLVARRTSFIDCIWTSFTRIVDNVRW